MNEIKSENIEQLELEGYRIVDIVAGDVAPTQELKYVIDKIIGEQGGTFYSDLLYNITSERFPEEEAKELWYGILYHKYMISERLGRNVGVRVASLDYLENVKKMIQSPKIIDETEFRKTLTLAVTDPLTGLFNRRKFNEELLNAIRDYKTKKKQFCLMMLDLDGFKEFNDTQGHHAGDMILQEFSSILKEEMRKDSIVGRYGGDEFVVIVNDVERISSRKVAERLRCRIESEFRDTKVTVSIGVAEFPVDGDSFDQIMSRVDEALYRAKEFGGNRVACFLPVTFKYKLSGTKHTEVACVGDFNRWQKKYGIMNYNEKEDTWSVTMNLKPGRYRYKFLVDGSKWITDPNAAEFVEDGFGGQCSIVIVPIEECGIDE